MNWQLSPEAGTPKSPRPPVKGLAALAVAMADWEELDDVVAEIYAARDASTDRPAPDPRLDNWLDAED